MRLPIGMTAIAKLDREEVNELAGILAYFFANEITQRENKLMTMPLRNEAYAEFEIDFQSENLCPDKSTIMSLKKIGE